MQAENDRSIGEIFRRLAVLRDLGEGPLDRAVRDVLQALGAAAHREAENRARILAARDAPRTGCVKVIPFADRKRPDPWFDDHDF